MLTTLGSANFQEILDLNSKSLVELIAVKNNENAAGYQVSQKQIGIYI